MRVFQDQRDVTVQEIINLPLSNLRLLLTTICGEMAELRQTNSANTFLSIFWEFFDADMIIISLPPHHTNFLSADVSDSALVHITTYSV